MKFVNVIRASIFENISYIVLLGYLFGILNMHFSDKTNYCVMTYMFEYPQFVHVSVPENKLYPQYRLYAYSEGRYTERARKMWFDGVPVLFLPGNSGSHMQARSLASVALRKAVANGYEHHFDFFTISYNEELSGLYGGVLHSQTEFAAACISKILNLYKENKYTKSVPNTVILIGHSMGGVIAKRLLAYPSTINSTSIAISLAAPLEAPVINFDSTINDYYLLLEFEWENYINKDDLMKEKKLMISIGNGARDTLMPSALISSNDSYINALTTAIPGVWVSPDHVAIVWCKQLVFAINRYLFSLVDLQTEQITENTNIWRTKARHFFQANRSMILSPDLSRGNITMLADAFWYEDNRRIYQISRPEIDRTTYLMIRLVKFPQNRFLAIEAVNTTDREWIFGCNAMYTHYTHRYCKYATSLTELGRWTGAAIEFGKRKVATVHLHDIMEMHPDWSHIVVKVSPTRKPVILNVDVNDLASRQITVELPNEFFGSTVVKEETEVDSLYYELLLPDFNALHQAYLLYVEPTAGCKATQYHVSAELHIPWAKNHEYYHYFTHLKKNPMKLRLTKSNPNFILGLELEEPAKVTLLLDPQCTYTISITTSWYNRLAQLARHYTILLVPYISAIILLAARSNILHLWKHGTCISVHSALMSEGVKPYYVLVFGRLASLVFMSTPLISFIFENASWKNLELQYFVKSLLVLPTYMAALGILNIAAAAILATMVFSSQLAHRLLFRIVWKGGSGLAEKVASGLQKVPLVVSVSLICVAPLSCGAASLAAGATFYAFMISKMYEEYLEDYVYKILAKIASRLCRFLWFKNKNKNAETQIIIKSNVENQENTLEQETTVSNKETDESPSNRNKGKANSELIVSDKPDSETKNVNSEPKCEDKKKRRSKTDNEIDEELNNLNFHMMLFLMWTAVTLVNVPALLTWARNFKYSIVLKPDTSYHTGLIMSLCSGVVWQMDGPRRNLRHYEEVSALLFTMAVFILALGPFSLTIVNYGITFMFAVITIQQLFDKQETANEEFEAQIPNQNNDKTEDYDKNKTSEDNKNNDNSEPGASSNENLNEDCVCNENRIYSMFKNLRDKISLGDNL